MYAINDYFADFNKSSVDQATKIATELATSRAAGVRGGARPQSIGNASSGRVLNRARPGRRPV